MNNYPEWWDQDITIYNKYEDPITRIITWYKHSVSGAFWSYKRDELKVGETTLETSNIICRIRKDPAFKEKYEWINLPNDLMESYFTLGTGDILIKGNVADTINEYSSGHRSSDLIAKYKELQGCMQVDAVSINVGRGRCNEHYLVKGL